MRLFLPIGLLSLLILSCGNSKKTTPKASEEFNLIGSSYYNYREIPFLKNYTKVSDTAFTAIEYKKEYDNTHRITELKEKLHTLILFNKVTLDDNRNENELPRGRAIEVSKQT